jgi:aromatic-L-amino-acid decarboxylase
MDHLNQTGLIYLTHTVVDGKFILRMCIGQTNTELKHVEQAWKLIKQTAKELCE